MEAYKQKTRILSMASRVLILACATILVWSCGEKDPDVMDQDKAPAMEDLLKPGKAITTTVAGVVVDESGSPLSGVEVEVHGNRATTTASGSFMFEDISVPENRCVVICNKQGYFTGSRALTPFRDETTSSRIVLMHSATTHTFEAATGIDASLDNGSGVQILPNALVRENGQPYSGAVELSVRYLDPTAGGFGNVVAGGDMLAQRTDGTTSILYSYGILRVKLTAADGQNLQLASGKAATLINFIPEEQRAAAPATIPLWYFDEQKGYWIEEGVAAREGDHYTGTVVHFTDWNCDDPKKGATIVGRLLDCDGTPAWGVLEFGQIASEMRSSTDSRVSDGKFRRRVPDGVPITVTINDPLLMKPLILSKQGRGKVIVVVPPLAPGQVYDVGDVQTFPCATQITATFKVKPGDAVESVHFINDNGSRDFHDVGEQLKINLPPDLRLRMYANTKSGVRREFDVETPAAAESRNLGEFDLTLRDTDEAFITGTINCYGNPENGGDLIVNWDVLRDNGVWGKESYWGHVEQDGSFRVMAPLDKTVELFFITPNSPWAKIVNTPANRGDVLELGVLEMCENELVGETSFVLNGDGFNNTKFNLITNKNSEEARAQYSPGFTNTTFVILYSLADTLVLDIDFPGNTTGVFNETKAKIEINREEDDGNYAHYNAGIDHPGSKLQLEIKRYDEVGGVIEGTFSGTFVKTYGLNEGRIVTISSGKFSALRHPDR